uniref:Uncharacterized protein n=1 Tax=Anopheles coluzzii TaxID=1518534 RepID=A0A8W7Q1M9_ANOCL
MQSASIMDMLTTPTAFPLKIDWEGKMEPASPSDFSFAKEESIFDDTYDYCKEDLFNNALIDLETDFKPEPSVLVDGSFLEVPLETLPEGRTGFFCVFLGIMGTKLYHCTLYSSEGLSTIAPRCYVYTLRSRFGIRLFEKKDVFFCIKR